MVGELAAVAGVALKDGVGREQGKEGGAVGVEHGALVFPGCRAVAGLAVETELAGMGIGVAVDAGRADPEKLEAFVAVLAADVAVRSA